MAQHHASHPKTMAVSIFLGWSIILLQLIFLYCYHRDGVLSTATTRTTTPTRTRKTSDVDDHLTSVGDNGDIIAVAAPCNCSIPKKWAAQSGQDKYIFERLIFQQGLCCKGTFVEFGARDGIVHSNTWAFEKFLGFRGLLFEVDPDEYGKLRQNRPRSRVFLGPVCPSYQSNMTLLLHGQGISAEEGVSVPKRSKMFLNRTRRQKGQTKLTLLPCFHLADELNKAGLKRVDYMIIDTEGSELKIIQDFPWDSFDVRIVQIEQINEEKYPSQRGRKKVIIETMLNAGYKLLSVFSTTGDRVDTEDLIFTRNLDFYLPMSQHPKDGLRFIPKDWNKINKKKPKASL